jgi:hypothetical protein
MKDELLDVQLIPWKGEPGIWGVTITYINGQMICYEVGTREQAEAYRKEICAQNARLIASAD